MERAALFELDLLAGRRGKSCEFGERPKWREAQGTRVAGKPPGPPFFWVLFFGGAKKSISPKGRYPNSNPTQMWKSAPSIGAHKRKYLARGGETLVKECLGKV
jgi:hypothetical protein